MPATQAIRVEGLAELNRAFARADKKLAREMRDTLRDVGEPVRADAERLAVAQIPKVTLPWAQMRVGVTRRSVYVAPRKRGAKAAQLRRPNFAGLLIEPMEQALDRNIGEAERRFDALLRDVGREWERG